MNILYRIYTQDVNRETIRDAVAQYFTNFTFILNAAGMWQGISEASLIVEIIGTLADAANVRAVAVSIRGYNNQDAVLITRSSIESELV